MTNLFLREINELIKAGKTNLKIYAEVAYKTSMNEVDLMYLIRVQRCRVDGTYILK